MAATPKDKAGGASLPSRRRPLRLIGGVDVSFVNTVKNKSQDESSDEEKEEEIEEGGAVRKEIPTQHEEEEAIACLVILSFPGLQVVHENFLRTSLTLPYISGFLAFRELSPLVQLVEELKQTHPGMYMAWDI